MNDKELWIQTATKLFLLPLIENENSLKWLNNKTIGIYTSDTNKPEWENKIVICYKVYGRPERIRVNFENNENSYTMYNESINGDSYLIVAFTIPPKFKKDFQHLLNGEYNKVSGQTQDVIINHWGKLQVPTARKIVYNIFCGNTHLYQNKPKLKDAVLNLNEVPIKKVDTVNSVSTCFLQRLVPN